LDCSSGTSFTPPLVFRVRHKPRPSQGRKDARGRTKARITVAIDPVLARGLDGQAWARGLTRSAVVEEAISEWLQRRIEETYRILERTGENERARSGRSEAAEAAVVAGMVLEALRHQFPAMRHVTDEELRRRALASQEKGRR
jgi:predicted transcriptional regulator